MSGYSKQIIITTSLAVIAVLGIALGVYFVNPTLSGLPSTSSSSFSSSSVVSHSSSISSTAQSTTSRDFEMIRLYISISYPGNWNGSYSYGNGCGSNLQNHVLWNGTGSENVSVNFVQNFTTTEFGYAVQFEKADNSSNTLTVSVQATTDGPVGLPSYNNSTSNAFGQVGFGGCTTTT